MRLNLFDFRNLTNLDKLILYNVGMTRTSYPIHLIKDRFPFEEELLEESIKKLEEEGYISKHNNNLKITINTNLLEVDEFFQAGDIFSKKLKILKSISTKLDFRNPFLKIPFPTNKDIYVSTYKLERIFSDSVFDKITALYYLLLQIHGKIIRVSWTIANYTKKIAKDSELSFYGNNFFEFIRKLKTIQGKAAINFTFVIDQLVQGYNQIVMYEYSGRYIKYNENPPILDSFLQRIIMDFFPTNQDFIIGIQDVGTTKTAQKGNIRINTIEIYNIDLSDIVGISVNIGDELYLVNLGSRGKIRMKNATMKIPENLFVHYFGRNYFLNDDRILYKKFRASVKTWYVTTEGKLYKRNNFVEYMAVKIALEEDKDG